MNKFCHYLDLLGLNWFVPVVRFLAGQDRAYQVRTFLSMVLPPVAAILLALGVWYLIAKNVHLGEMSLPTPGDVGQRAGELSHDQAFLKQVLLSLKTAFAGVFLGVIIAVPLGILCGLSGVAFSMANPLIQILKPVSPLAWFPVVYIIVNKLMEGVPNDGFVSKSFLIAMLVVTLCSLWPSLINTANGVANVEKDHLNVARVLNLGVFSRIWRVILPSSLPHIFTGMRLSMGIGWMVLIAAEMMAVSPGLGGFIWDWYQSSNDVALSYLLLAVMVIGGIGFLLDRIFIACQKLVSHGSTATIR